MSKVPATVTNETDKSAAVTDSIVKKGRTLNDVISAFDSYCLPWKNLVVEAFKFNVIVQKQNQPFAEFETELRIQMAFFEFECDKCQASYADRMLRDRLIIGIRDKSLQLKLLDAKDEPLNNVIEMCKIHEAASEHKQLFEKNEALSLNNVELHAESKDVVSIQRSDFHNVRCFNCGQAYNGSFRATVQRKM